MLAMLWSVLLLAPSIHAFFHVLSTKKFNMTSLPTDSLFGYSITYQSSINSLIVSAPKANEIGEVFKIDLNSNTINQISFPLKKDNASSSSDGFWLGASVKASADFFVACAPRHSQMVKIFGSKSPKLTATGTCFLSQEGVPPKPLKSLAKKVRNLYHTFVEKFDSFGWGLDISPKNKVLIGGPGTYRGRAALYSDPLKFSHPNLLLIDNDLPLYNFGYSVASGKFCSDNIQYAVSSTFGTYGQGQVYFFNSKNNKYVGRISGEGIGSMFGAALCSARLEGSKDHMLVGAPAFADNAHSHDVGAVYIYDTCSSQDQETNHIRILKGNSKGSYFGKAIVSVGDMDGDGSDEIVIGAPYADEGRGIVYVYSGADLLQGKAPLQTIQAEGLSFGFSLTALKDYDDNGSNELAIGSPHANNVFLLRSFASITVKLRAHLPDIEARENKTFLTLKSCIDVVYPTKPKKIKADIVITVTIGYLNSFLNSDKKEMLYEVTLRKTIETDDCKSIAVLTPTEITGEYNQIISYTITANLKENPKELKVFDPSRVLLSKDSVLYIQDQRGYSTCGDSVCIPKLNGEFFSSLTKLYVIGSTNTETFSLLVQNDGDIAYDACMVFEVYGVPILSVQRTCTIAGNETIMCKPNQVIQTGKTWNTGDITLDTKKLSSKNEDVTIKYNIYNHCLNESDKESFEEHFELIGESRGLSVHGISVPDKTYSVTTDSEDSRITLQHVYTIINNGVTNWDNVQCNITLNNAKYLKGPNVLIDINLDSSNIECTIPKDIRQDGSVTGICEIGDLGRSKKGTIHINIIIEATNLETLANGQNVTLETSLELILPKVHVNSASVKTSIGLLKAKVDIWIIIVSSIVGLLICFIIAGILYATGFFERKNKNKLQNLQRSVHTQSQRRSMMRNSILNALNRNSYQSLAEENENYVPS